MLSLEFVCQHPDMVREALRKRREATDIDDILRLSQQRRALVTGRDGLYVSLKRLHEAITTVPPAERVILNQQIKALNKELRVSATPWLVCQYYPPTRSVAATTRGLDDSVSPGSWFSGSPAPWPAASAPVR